MCLAKTKLNGGTRDEKDSIISGSMSGNSRFSPATGKKISFGINPGVDVCGHDEWMSVTSRNGGVGKELWREVVEDTGDQRNERAEPTDNPLSVESDFGGGTGSGNYEVGEPGAGSGAVSQGGVGRTDD